MQTTPRSDNLLALALSGSTLWGEKTSIHIALPTLQVKPETRLQPGRSALDTVKEPAHAQPLGASRSWAPPGPD